HVLRQVTSRKRRGRRAHVKARGSQPVLQPGNCRHPCRWPSFRSDPAAAAPMRDDRSSAQGRLSSFFRPPQALSMAYVAIAIGNMLACNPVFCIVANVGNRRSFFSPGNGKKTCILRCLVQNGITHVCHTVCDKYTTQSILPHSEGDARIALASLGLLQDSKKG
ncbi:unnamed protein product, partial [Trichogramma brassicae]